MSPHALGNICQVVGSSPHSIYFHAVGLLSVDFMHKEQVANLEICCLAADSLFEVTFDGLCWLGLILYGSIDIISPSSLLPGLSRQQWSFTVNSLVPVGDISFYDYQFHQNHYVLTNHMGKGSRTCCTSDCDPLTPKHSWCNGQDQVEVILETIMWSGNQDQSILQVHVDESRPDKSWCCFKVICCLSRNENESREQSEKPSNAKQPLWMYNSSASLESFLILQCNIWIFLHNLAHHQHNSGWYNYATISDIATHQTTFVSYQNYRHHSTTIPYNFHVSQCLPLSVTIIPFPVPLLMTWAVTVSDP